MMKRILFTLAIAAFFLPSASLFTGCEQDNIVPDDEKVDDGGDEGDGTDEPVGVERSVSLDVTEIPEMTVGGETYTLTATFEGEGTDALAFEWSSSDEQVAVVEQGETVATATVTAVAPGSATITIAYKDEASGIDLSASATVTVKAAEPEYVPDGKLRILAIGNSFSQDAVEQYLWDLFDAAGQEAIIGNMYIGGCSLDTHWENAQGDKAAYAYRKITDNTGKKESPNQKLSEVLASEPWDYVSLQQASGQSGIYSTYTHLQDLIGYVKEHATLNPDMKIVFHQTWAYQNGSDHAEFPKYDSDQMTMYGDIMSAVQQAVASNPDIAFVIPSGTAVQNGRTSFIGDNFCRDGYHLEVNYGRFTASCTWYEAVSRDWEATYPNVDLPAVTDNTWKPEAVSDFYAEIAKNAAYMALEKPYEVTEMTEFQTPDITSDGNTPIYVDFGSRHMSTELPWTNNVGNPGVSENVTYLSDANGDYTNAVLSITSPFSDAFNGVGTENNAKDETFGVNGLVFPYNVWTDALMVGGKKTDVGDGDKGPAVIRISGLDAGKSYDFTILSCRWEGSVAARQTKFTVKGNVESAPVILNPGMPKGAAWSTYDLTDYVAVFDEVVPDADGCVEISVTGVDAGSTVVEGHINALVIEPAAE